MDGTPLAAIARGLQFPRPLPTKNTGINPVMLWCQLTNSLRS